MNKLIAVFVLSSALVAGAADATATPATATPATATPAVIPGKPTQAAVPVATLVANARTRCLSAVTKLLNTNLKACKERLSNPQWNNCKQDAYNIAKLERAACPVVKSKTK